jgi:hypothetical protein
MWSISKPQYVSQENTLASSAVSWAPTAGCLDRIASSVIESLVCWQIMIGILFFLFEFFDDQLLAFMVLTLVWLCELYTMIRYVPNTFCLSGTRFSSESWRYLSIWYLFIHGMGRAKFLIHCTWMCVVQCEDSIIHAVLSALLLFVFHGFSYLLLLVHIRWGLSSKHPDR